MAPMKSNRRTLLGDEKGVWQAEWQQISVEEEEGTLIDGRR